MFPRSKRGAGTVGTLAAALALAIALAAVPTVLGASEPFVTAKVQLNQTVKSLLRGRFVQTITCRDDCSVTARIFIRPRVAKKLGFKRVKANQPYAIALKQVRLTGGHATTIRIPLGSEAKKRLPKLKQRTIQITGETYASSMSSDGRGQANWITTLRR